MRSAGIVFISVMNVRSRLNNCITKSVTWVLFHRLGKQSKGACCFFRPVVILRLENDQLFGLCLLIRSITSVRPTARLAIKEDRTFVT